MSASLASCAYTGACLSGNSIFSMSGSMSHTEGACQCDSAQSRASQRPLGPLLVPGSMNLHNRWILSCASWQFHSTWRQSEPGQIIRKCARRQYQNVAAQEPSSQKRKTRLSRCAYSIRDESLVEAHRLELRISVKTQGISLGRFDRLHSVDLIPCVHVKRICNHESWATARCCNAAPRQRCDTASGAFRAVYLGNSHTFLIQTCSPTNLGIPKTVKKRTSAVSDYGRD